MLSEEQVAKAKRDGWAMGGEVRASAPVVADEPTYGGGYWATFEGGCLDGQRLAVQSLAPERVAWPDRDVPAGGPAAWNGRAPIPGAHVYRLRVVEQPVQDAAPELVYVFRRVARR